MGPTTMGNPFLLVIITSPGNLSKLERLRQVNGQISDPRGLSEAQVRALVAEGKAVICQSMSLHATEIGGTQMAPELAYDLLARKDEETQRILDNVVFLMVPSFNPDGEIMVNDWYQKTLGTEYEGTSPPSLYHKYAGHDNNRDAFMTNMVESQYMAKILFTDWKPEAYVDHHHMGSYGARIFLPPYAEPVRPVRRSADLAGAELVRRAHGLQGRGGGPVGRDQRRAVLRAGATSDSTGSRRSTTSRACSPNRPARAWRPRSISFPTSCRAARATCPSYEAETIFPNPWPGGWWRLRDVMDRQKVAAWAALDLAARNRETVLWNAYLKGKRQTERGAQFKPAAYVIPVAQHDRLTAVKLVNKLLVQGIEIQRVSKTVTAADGMTYPEGSFVVSMAQPKMGLIRYLLGRTFFPDNDWTRNKDGSPIRPYDMATDTMYEFMGVRVDPVNEAVKGDLAKLDGARAHGGKGGGGRRRLLARRAAERQLQGGEPAARKGREGAADRPAGPGTARRRFRRGRGRGGDAGRGGPRDGRGFHGVTEARSGKGRTKSRGRAWPCTRDTAEAISTRAGRAGCWRTSTFRTRRCSMRRSRRAI